MESFFQLNLWTQLGTLHSSLSVNIPSSNSLFIFLSVELSLVLNPSFLLGVIQKKSLYLAFGLQLWCDLQSKQRICYFGHAFSSLPHFANFPSHRWFPDFLGLTQIFSVSLLSPLYRQLYSSWWLDSWLKKANTSLPWHLNVISSILFGLTSTLSMGSQCVDLT